MKDNSSNKETSLENQASENQTNKQRILNIKQVFLKRLEFKTYANPLEIESVDTESAVNININHEKRTEKEYLISLAIELEGYQDNQRIKKSYVLLVEVFGLFEISEFRESEKNLLFYGFCANTLFPYVRNHISQTLSSSGFKPILLSPINFEQLYLAKLKEKQAKQNQTNQADSERNQTNQGTATTKSKSDKKIDPTNPKVH